MHKLCEKCEKNSWCKLGTHEYMHPVLDSGCDGFHEKGKSKGKGKANPSAYHIGYAEGQRDAEQIKSAQLLQRATSAEALLATVENKASEYKSWAAKAVKEADALRKRVEELEAIKAEQDYIIKQFESWESGENGCPRMNDIDFTCEEEERFKPDMNYPCFEPEFCEDEDGCWVKYYRWKYRQKQKQEKKEGER